MNVGFWNCRGVKRKNFATEINYLRLKNRIELLCLAETKQQRGPSSFMLKKMGFQHSIWAPSNGTRGGLWLLASGPTFASLQVIEITTNFIIVKTILEETELLLIFVYIPSYDQQKSECWSKITSLILF